MSELPTLYGKSNIPISMADKLPQGKKIKEIYDRVDVLKEHWGSGIGKVMTAPASDAMYKHHLTSLMNIYGQDNPAPLGRRMEAIRRPKGISDLTKLYGINGLLRRDMSPLELEEREKGWDVYTTDARTLTPNRNSEHPMLGRPANTSEEQGEGGGGGGGHRSSRALSPVVRPESASARHRPRSARIEGRTAATAAPARRSSPSPGPSSARTERPATSGATRARYGQGMPAQSSSSSSRRQAFAPASSNAQHRYCVHDRDATDEELISRGAYRLSEGQEPVYWNFVEMLRTFDPHDMVLVLEDAFKDARAASMLDSYGGFGAGDSGEDE